jgi:hypothetical protein
VLVVAPLSGPLHEDNAAGAMPNGIPAPMSAVFVKKSRLFMMNLLIIK